MVSRAKNPSVPMTAYLAKNNDTPADTWVDDLGCGAGRCRCFECKGTGTSLFPVEVTGALACPQCKGTGWILISV